MPASNLGIVFGPNLLRQRSEKTHTDGQFAVFIFSLFFLRDMVASLALLADMTAQAKVIEILISHVHEVGSLRSHDSHMTVT